MYGVGMDRDGVCPRPQGIGSPWAASSGYGDEGNTAILAAIESGLGKPHVPMQFPGMVGLANTLMFAW